MPLRDECAHKHRASKSVAGRVAGDHGIEPCQYGFGVRPEAISHPTNTKTSGDKPELALIVSVLDWILTTVFCVAISYALKCILR